MYCRFLLRGVGLLCALALLSVTASCAAPAEDDAATGDALTNQNPDPETACAATPAGVLVTSAGDVGYDGGTATSSSKHLQPEGCLTELTLGFARGESCPLSLTLREKDGAWTLAAGSLTVDDSCGLDGVAKGEYTLSADGATGALSEAPSATSSEECVSADKIALMGQGDFVNGGQTLTLTLDQLALSGETTTEIAESGSCPSLATACDDIACGSDEYGNQCGACELGYVCDVGECKVEGCPPVGPYGVEPYKTLTDLEIFDCDGNPVHLHELCGAPAGFFNLLAGW